MPDEAILTELPLLPADDDGPVFKAPWEAQAFAMTVKLHERGHFTWSEWTEHLAREIAAAKARGEPDLGDRYYEYWLAALEKLTAARGLTSRAELGARKAQWERAARESPHGEPIVLKPDEG